MMSRFASLSIILVLALSCRTSASALTSALFTTKDGLRDLNNYLVQSDQGLSKPPRQILLGRLQLEQKFGADPHIVKIGFYEPYDEDEDTGVNGGDAVAHFYRTKLKNHFRQKKMTNGVNGPNRETDMPLVLPSSKSNSGKELTGLRKLRQQTTTSVDYKLLRRLRSDPWRQLKLRKMPTDELLGYPRLQNTRLKLLGLNRQF